MKKFKRFIYVIAMCICMLFTTTSVPLVVNAEETESVEPRMAYISSYTNDLIISSTGNATIYGAVRGKAGTTSTYVKCTLQISISGGWVDVKSWEASSTTFDATVAETYQLSSRGTYRVYTVCRANTEEKTITSAYRTY